MHALLASFVLLSSNPLPPYCGTIVKPLLEKGGTVQPLGPGIIVQTEGQALVFLPYGTEPEPLVQTAKESGLSVEPMGQCRTGSNAPLDVYALTPTPLGM